MGKIRAMLAVKATSVALAAGISFNVATKEPIVDGHPPVPIAAQTNRTCNSLFSSTEAQPVLALYPAAMPEADREYRKIIEIMQDKTFIDAINSLQDPTHFTEDGMLQFALFAKLTAHIYVKGRLLQEKADECNHILHTAQFPSFAGTRTETDYEGVCRNIQNAALLYLSAAAKADPTLQTDLTRTATSLGLGTGGAIIAATCGGNAACDALALTLAGLQFLSNLSSLKSDLWRRLFTDELIWLNQYKTSATEEVIERLTSILAEKGITNAEASQITGNTPRISLTDIALSYVSDTAKDAITERWNQRVDHELERRLSTELAAIRRYAYIVPGMYYGYMCNQSLPESDVIRNPSGGNAMAYIERRDTTIREAETSANGTMTEVPFETMDTNEPRHDPYLRYCPCTRHFSEYITYVGLDGRPFSIEKRLGEFERLLITDLQGRTQEIAQRLTDIESHHRRYDNNMRNPGDIRGVPLDLYGESIRHICWRQLPSICEHSPWYQQAGYGGMYQSAIAALSYLRLGDIEKASRIKSAIENIIGTEIGGYYFGCDMEDFASCLPDNRDCYNLGCGRTPFVSRLEVISHGSHRFRENLLMVILHAELEENEKALRLLKLLEENAYGDYEKKYREDQRFCLSRRMSPCRSSFFGEVLAPLAMANYAVGNRERARELLRRSDFLFGFGPADDTWNHIAHLYIDHLE